MIGKYRMRTDLAMENQEKFERDHVEILSLIHISEPTRPY